MTNGGSLIAMILVTAVSVASFAQEGLGDREQTPYQVSVIAGTGQRLKPGDKFTFLLKFDRAPRGFGEGTVQFSFKNISPRQNTDSNFSERTDLGGSMPLQDGQAVYAFTAEITEDMAPGKWILHSVALGRRVPRTVPVPSDVGFEIPFPSPLKLKVKAPSHGAAGQSISLTVDLVDFPNLGQPSCSLYISAHLEPIQGDARLPQNSFVVNSGGTELKPDQRSYEMYYPIDREAPGGRWQGKVSVYAGPKPQPTRLRRPQMNRFCRTPPIEGETSFIFDVEPGPEEIVPSSVAVVVNSSQIELLSAEADRLKAKAEKLSQVINSGNEVNNITLLQNSLIEAITDVDKTEKSFLQRGDAGLSSSQTVQSFFDDIRYGYAEAITRTGHEAAELSLNQPRLQRASVSMATGGAHLARTKNSVLNSILHNAQVYAFAATSGSLTFTLEVYSDPDHGTISYRQRGDKEYTFISHPTDWRIENLPIGVYLIRVQKMGYNDKEVPYDASTSTIPSVKIALEKTPPEKKRRAK